MRDIAPDASKRERRDAAGDWWVRLDAGALSPSELAAFRAWLTSDPANEAAFEEVCDLWGASEQLRRRLLPPIAHSSPPGRYHKWTRPAAALATALLALSLVFDNLSLLWRADVRTGKGEITTVTLPDGSRAHLNADSALSLDYAGGRRRIALLAGEAWFEVEKDPSRPFTVETIGGTITARGTAFDVSTNRARTEVTVTEHSVEVESKGRAVIVEVGQQTAFGPDLPALAPYSADPDGVTAWRRGKLIVKDQSLGEVIDALGRYHHGLVVIAGRTIRDRRVSGVFQADHPLDALKTIEKSLGLRAVRLTDYLIVLYS
ncbi:FecR family protein [Methylosinus sp. LW4]|uniref:FecR family protein n=1 Tax=Methylosinus sp. LW4 TaxID=136993 RepID=UPI0003717E99|nr:FecR family protein [Methylosinus sp. LW4]